MKGDQDVILQKKSSKAVPDPNQLAVSSGLCRLKVTYMPIFYTLVVKRSHNFVA